MARQPDEHPRSHKVSGPAARALHEIKTELHCWDAYLEQATTSVTIELLVWFWREVRREGKTDVSPLDFKPETRVGRPADRNQFRNARPSDHRLE